jgi:hypothetical protein
MPLFSVGSVENEGYFRVNHNFAIEILEKPVGSQGQGMNHRQ